MTYILMYNFHPCFPREGISFIGHNSGITGLALAGSNKLLSLAEDGKLSVWDLATKIRLAIYLYIFLIMLVFLDLTVVFKNAYEVSEIKS